MSNTGLSSTWHPFADLEPCQASCGRPSRSLRKQGGTGSAFYEHRDGYTHTPEGRKDRTAPCICRQLTVITSSHRTRITTPNPSIAPVLVRTKSIPVSVIDASVTQTTRSRARSGHWLPFMRLLLETTALEKQQRLLRIGSKNSGKPERMSILIGFL